jgi:hypothetical protein
VVISLFSPILKGMDWRGEKPLVMLCGDIASYCRFLVVVRFSRLRWVRMILRRPHLPTRGEILRLGLVNEVADDFRGRGEVWKYVDNASRFSRVR